ncbi:hypothetical protein TNCV_2093071 [Trichonephila clavipes]|nr:hypothetical protein TNCV_2093071 [Trichonephila clavipes]
MHQRSSVGDGRFLPTSSDVTNQWPGLVSRRCWSITLILVLCGRFQPRYPIPRFFERSVLHNTVGDRLTNTFTKDSCVRITNTFKKDFLCLNNEHIFGGDHGDTPEIMDEILTAARDLELEVNEDDIEKLIMGHEDELTTEELQELLNEEHQETQRNVFPSEQEEDERGPMPTSAIKDLLKKWEDARTLVLEYMAPKLI